MSTRLSRLAVVSSLLALAACAGPTSSTDTTDVRPETFAITNPAASLGTSTIGARSIGNFRVKPTPGEDREIHVFTGEAVTVNASDYRSSYPGVTLYLIANWGDGGGNERVGCGPCRVSHSYEAPGRYMLEMTIDDGIVAPATALSPETEVVTVVVTGQGEKPDPVPPAVVIPGGRPSATWTSISIACGTLNTTVRMRVTDPDNDSSLFTVFLTGGTLTSAPTGGPVPSGGTITINFTGTPGLSVLRVDLVDSQGAPSLPITRYGPSPTCGGQTLHILG
jgi:hypothetical protein